MFGFSPISFEAFASIPIGTVIVVSTHNVPVEVLSGTV